MTVNDYLARRDAQWMSPIYLGLGMTVGILQNMQEYEAKQVAYACDVTYGVNKEIAFDYLRDGLTLGNQRSYANDYNVFGFHFRIN